MCVAPCVLWKYLDQGILFDLREERLSEIFDLLLLKQVYATRIDGVMIGDNMIAQKNAITRIDITPEGQAKMVVILADNKDRLYSRDNEGNDRMNFRKAHGFIQPYSGDHLGICHGGLNGEEK
jgi:hypothetical protein